MEMLPGWCHVNSAHDPDLGWSRQELLLATACNILIDIRHAITSKKGDPAPKHIGPRWMAEAGLKKLRTRHMSIKDLDAEIGRFAEAAARRGDG